VRLKGKRAFISGAGGGIGRATALKFAAEGAALICADINKAALAETETLLKAAGATYRIVTGDLSDPSQCEAAITQAAAAYDGLDIIFNNAGIVHAQDAGPIETPLAAWDKTIAVNLTAVFLVCKYALPHLLKSGNAAIINNASIVALLGSAYPQIAYTAAKGGVLAMTREIAVMYARQGLRANAICPGPVATPLVTAFLADDAAWNLRRPYLPQGRLADPSEIANLVAFLASDEASYITAAAYPIDGGITGAYVIDDSK
jgi:NAD(P)-dependent dehydrogenase (short-subunit alcohol dehydrogenase family)